MFVTRVTSSNNVSPSRGNNEIQPDMDHETQQMLSIVTNVTHSSDPFFSVNDFSFDRGLNYDWSRRIFPVSVIVVELVNVACWLHI